MTLTYPPHYTSPVMSRGLPSFREVAEDDGYSIGPQFLKLPAPPKPREGKLPTFPNGGGGLLALFSFLAIDPACPALSIGLLLPRLRAVRGGGPVP